MNNTWATFVQSSVFSRVLIGFAACLLVSSNVPAQGIDWLTHPSTYTHSPVSGERVEQYAQVQSPPMNDQSNLMVSGYTNFRSTIQFGQSADNYYRVNQWGPPVRPYGEWLFPYRPYSAPYPEWGAPYAGLQLGLGNQGFGGGFPGTGYPGAGYPGAGFPGTGVTGGGYPAGGIPGQPYPPPYPVTPNGPYPVPPWYDGYHPDYPVQQPLNDQDFFKKPQS